MRRPPSPRSVVLTLVVAILGLLAGLGHRSLSAQEGPRPDAPTGPGPHLLVDGDYREALLQALDAARERIDIVMFSTIIYDDSSSKHPVRQVLDRVIARHRAGVAVRVVLDHGVPPAKRRPGEEPPSDQAYSLLKDSGVPVRWDEDDRTTHVKCVVIDGKTILMGSHNWSSSALTKNREWSVLLHDPALAAQVAEEIDRLWRR